MNYKTLVPSVVGAGVLVYESITGHIVSSVIQNQIINGGITLVGFGLTLYGIWKNHKKG